MSLLWSKITKSVQEYSHMRYIGHKEEAKSEVIEYTAECIGFKQ